MRWLIDWLEDLRAAGTPCSEIRVVDGLGPHGSYVHAGDRSAILMLSACDWLPVELEIVELMDGPPGLGGTVFRVLDVPVVLA